MQEEVENRTLTLVVNGSKFTGQMLKAAICKYMAHRKEVKNQKRQRQDGTVIPRGKQTVQQLIGQDQGVSTLELTDPSIRQFDRIARKYGVDYAIKRDGNSDPPKFLVFFKSRDADALTAVFNQYAGAKIKKISRPSVLQKLAAFKDMVRDSAEKVRKKVLER